MPTVLLLSVAHMISEQGKGVSVETSVPLWSIRAQPHYWQWCHSKVKAMHVRGQLDTRSCWSCAPAECSELILVPCTALPGGLHCMGTGTNFFTCKPGKLLSSALAFLAHPLCADHPLKLSLSHPKQGLLPCQPSLEGSLCF